MDPVIGKIGNARDFEYAVQLTRWLLLPLGLWPIRPSRYLRILRPVSILMCIFIMLFVIIPLCLFMFILVKDIGIRLKLIGPLSFGALSLFKYIVVILKDREIAACMVRMSLDWREITDQMEYRIMSRYARTGRLLTIVCIIFMYSGGMPYITILPLIKGSVVRGNVTLLPLAYPSYFVFFNPQVRPIYDFVFVTHCMCGLVRYSVTCGVYSIAIICVMHIRSQAALTSRMLEQLADNFNIKLLGRIVEQHLRFVKFAAKLEEIFSGMYLIEVLGSTCIICFLGYYLITEFENRDTVALFTYVFLMLSFVFNIFILCYVGESLTEECYGVGKAVYTMKWYQLSGKEARNLLFLLTSTQRPVVLTAGKMIDLSLQSFTNIIKAAASYLNMLRTLIDDSPRTIR